MMWYHWLRKLDETGRLNWILSLSLFFWLLLCSSYLKILYLWALNPEIINLIKWLKSIIRAHFLGPCVPSLSITDAPAKEFIYWYRLVCEHLMGFPLPLPSQFPMARAKLWLSADSVCLNFRKDVNFYRIAMYVTRVIVMYILPVSLSSLNNLNTTLELTLGVD